MERFDKTRMNIHSKEYDTLLKKEIDVWSAYASGKGSVSSFEEIKKTHSYQIYRKGTIELELSHIAKLQGPISVLELGSADGWLSNEIATLDNVRDITSIDISLEKNREKYTDKTIALQGDLNKIENIHFEQKYNCIITHGTLHHLVDPKKTLMFCLDNLLLEGGILIVNDTWILKSLQLKTNALFYLLLNRLGHSILKLNITECLSILFHKTPYILLSKDFAASIAHSYETSPFESVSSADDYKDIYERKDLNQLFFRRYAALPGLQNSWMRSPLFVKHAIQKIDNFLIKNNIYSGDFHICIMQKVK